MFQAIKSMQFSIPGQPFPLPDRRQVPLYSCSKSEYSLSDPYSARPEVPSPGSREVSSVLLCLGGQKLFSCVSPATKLAAFLGGPFLAAIFPLSSLTWASILKVGSPSHFLMSFSWSHRKNQNAHVHASGIPFPSDWVRKRLISWGFPESQGADP